MAHPNDPPLDEIQWHSPQAIESMGGLHSNTILFYFAESPFFERTSNNAVVMSQAMHNISMYHYIQTREAFEARLRTMSGLEFVVGEEPAESGPGMGTGVWVIRKQTRRLAYDGEAEITLHASFFVVGEHIYKAPTLADVLTSRIMTISSAISKALPAAESLRKWRPSHGHVYQLPTKESITTRPRGDESKEGSKAGTPMPNVTSKSIAEAPVESASQVAELDRVAEEAFMLHLQHGGEYVDENPIKGRPGEFHLSSTGRKAVPPPQAQQGLAALKGPTLNTKVDTKKDDKPVKTPKSATAPKPKRRKSKAASTVTSPT